MTHADVASQLKVLLADSYALYLKTQNYHWNVTGPNFKALHDLFEDQYTDLAVAIDDIAERIRAIGEKAPGTWQEYDNMTGIEAGNQDLPAEVMVRDLADSQTIILKTLTEVMQAAQEVNDEATIALVTDRMMVHEKSRWMLISSSV